jgi:hypothetical protein
MSLQNPSEVLMRAPIHFSFNDETAASNAFQNSSSISNLSEIVLDEFKNAVTLLENNGIVVHSEFPVNLQNTPDEVFPNNWFALLPSGELVLFPMEAPNRRLERNETIIDSLKKRASKVIDLSSFEDQNRFLEGTGSIIFDHDHRLAFCCESSRSDVKLLESLCRQINYEAISFLSEDLNGQAVYHTNVVMSIGENYVVICLESINDLLERAMIKAKIETTGKAIIDISFDQVNSFCGNILELKSKSGALKTIVSSTAFDTFRSDQKEILSRSSDLVVIPVDTIEKVGGGSIRCIIAGLHC